MSVKFSKAEYTVSADKVKLGSILNEATVRSFEIDPEMRRASLRVDILALSQDADARGIEVELRFDGVTRILGSLRAGHWSDRKADILPLELDELPSVVASFGPLEIYGDQFLDSQEPWTAPWVREASLDWHPTEPDGRRTFDFFQEASDRHLDLRVWFEQLEVLSRTGVPAVLDDLVAASDRWWAAMRAGDSRTASSGIFPLRNE